MALTILVLNGPNLNLLGKREPGLYGTGTLADIEALCAAKGKALGLRIDFRQTNIEGVLVDWIQQAPGSAAGIVLNAGAYTHTSIAIHDALRASGLPVIEVHLSNIFARERFRHHSFVSPVAKGVIVGLGPAGYTLALEALAGLVSGETPAKKQKETRAGRQKVS
jgi:3-dehydroquinate dehydratase-2